MAVMLPETLPPDAHPAEKRIHRLLQEDPATEKWVVLYSIRPRARRRMQRRREIDFLLLIPYIGVLCLEVKSGAFEVRDGQWWRPNAAAPEEPPTHQAQTAMFDLLDELTGKFGNSWRNAALPLGCAVILTDAAWPRGVREPERPVIGLPDLPRNGSLSLARKLVEVARTIRDEIPAPRRVEFTTALAKEVQDYIAYDASIVVVPRQSPYNEYEEQIIRVTREQYRCLESARQHDRCLFTGGAGTGKTMLALQLARQLAEEGNQVALICYNRILGDWLSRDWLRTLKLSHDKVGSFWHHFAYEVIRSNPEHYERFAAEMDRALAENPGSEEAARRRQFDEITPEFTRNALLENHLPKFDYLIVDELQDMCQSPYLEIMDLALAGGLKEGRWAMFCDFNQHTEPRNPHSNLVNLDALAGDYFTQELLINCRNTQPIVEDSDNVIGIDRAPEHEPQIKGPEPTYRYWKDAADLRYQLHEEVQHLLSHNEDITQTYVLGTNRLKDSALDLPLNSYGGYNLLDCPGIYWPLVPPRCDQHGCCYTNENPSYLNYRTIRRFKGMECRNAILIVERLESLEDEKLLYVGFTRARINLIVLAHESLKPRIEELVKD